MKKQIDINCDLGEGKTAGDWEHDARLMAFISRCNIACGGHAGSVKSIRLSLQNAQKHGILAGVHPGYQDPEHFGRVSKHLPWTELEDQLSQQLQLVLDIASQEGVLLHHIKLHGALYNDTEKRPEQAKNIAKWIMHHYPNLTVIGLANGALQKACAQYRLDFMAEAFIDRRYLPNGQLSPRQQQGAVITRQEDAVSQAMALAKQQQITSIDGAAIVVKAHTLCLHGDNPNALPMLKVLRAELALAGITVC